MDRTMNSIGKGYRFCVLGDLNGWIEDWMRAGTTGPFGVPGENGNGKRVVEFCAERRLCVSNTYFEHKGLHKYTKLARGQDGVEIRSMIDLVLVKKDMLHYAEDVRTVRGMGRGLSDHRCTV